MCCGNCGSGNGWQWNLGVGDVVRGLLRFRGGGISNWRRNRVRGRIRAGFGIREWALRGGRTIGC